MNKDSYFQFDSFDFNLFVSKTFVAVLEHSCFAKVVDCLGSSLKPWNNSTIEYFRSVHLELEFLELQLVKFILLDVRLLHTIWNQEIMHEIKRVCERSESRFEKFGSATSVQLKHSVYLQAWNSI